MTVELFANQPSTTVSSGGTDAPASGTPETWTVASSSGFAAASAASSPPGQFHVADIAAGATTELIAVTNITGTTWSVTRGAESTTPVAHSAGFTITQVVSAGVLRGFGLAAPPSGTVSTSGTLSASLQLWYVNAAAGNTILTLPPPGSVTALTYRLKRTDSTTSMVTIAPSAAELIDGASFGYIPNSVAELSLISDGTNWWCM